jgi:hypothetical protein
MLLASTASVSSSGAVQRLVTAFLTSSSLPFGRRGLHLRLEKATIALITATYVTRTSICLTGAFSTLSSAYLDISLPHRRCGKHFNSLFKACAAMLSTLVRHYMIYISQPMRMQRPHLPPHKPQSSRPTRYSLVSGFYVPGA